MTFLFLNYLRGAEAFAQVIPLNDLDTARVFFDLNKAIENRENVLRLDLSKQKLIDFPEEIFQLQKRGRKIGNFIVLA